MSEKKNLSVEHRANNQFILFIFPNIFQLMVIILFSPVKDEDFLEMAGGSVFRAISDLKDFPKIWNTYALENANVQKFIHSTGLHFDLIVMEEFFSDSFLMFAHKFKAPVVTICELFLCGFLLLFVCFFAQNSRFLLFLFFFRFIPAHFVALFPSFFIC